MGIDGKVQRQKAKGKRQNEEAGFSAILTFAFWVLH
jgi:hypothetical protein